MAATGSQHDFQHDFLSPYDTTMSTPSNAVKCHINAEAKKLKPRPSQGRVRGTVKRLLEDIAITSKSRNPDTKAKVLVRVGKFLKRAAYASSLIASFVVVYKSSNVSNIIKQYVNGTLPPPPPSPLPLPPTTINRAKNAFGYVSEAHAALDTVEWALGILGTLGTSVARYVTWRANPVRRMRS